MHDRLEAYMYTFQFEHTIENIVYKHKQLEQKFIEIRLKFQNNFRIFGIELPD